MTRFSGIAGPGLVANNGGVGTSLSVLTQRRGRLFSVVATNTTEAELFLQVYDVASGTAPAGVPVASVSVGGGLTSSLDWSAGRPFALGIFVGFSTAALGFGAAAGNALIDVCYDLD